MSMQTDVLSAHTNQSGFMVIGRCRLKGFLAVSSSTAGTVNVWDTTSTPTSMTYGRSGTTVTVTQAAHGLKTGDIVGLTFADRKSTRLNSSLIPLSRMPSSA